jgi:hypothetical protein
VTRAADRAAVDAFGVRSLLSCREMRVLVPYPYSAAVAVAVVLAAAGRPAAAQVTEVEAAATANVGYSQTSRSFFVPDPMAQPSDMPGDTENRMFMEIRPGISIQTGSPRLAWRAGYIFAGMLSIVGDSLSAYSNAVNGEMAAVLTPRTNLTMAANIAQGGTSFLLTQQTADAGRPDFRAPGNPNQISATVAESLSSEVAKHFTLQQTLSAGINAPQDSFGERNSAVSAGLGLDRGFERDAIGVEVHGTVSWLRPLRTEQDPYKSYTSSLAVHWNRDFTLSWSGSVTAGVEQVFTDTGSRPLAFLPAGAASLRYAPRDDLGFGVDFSHGTATNLQVGSISVTDRVGVHGNIAIDTRDARALAFSAGFLHNEPLGEIAAAVAAGTGNAVQVDVGFVTRLAKNIMGTVRYSLAYQYGQGGGLPSQLANIFFIGVTGSIRNTERAKRPVPVRGHRVDGNDSWGLGPDEGTPVEPPPTSTR